MSQNRQTELLILAIPPYSLYSLPMYVTLKRSKLNQKGSKPRNIKIPCYRVLLLTLDVKVSATHNSSSIHLLHISSNLLTLCFFCFLDSSAAIPAASFRYLLPTLLSNHFRSTKTSLKCSRSNY